MVERVRRARKAAKCGPDAPPGAHLANSPNEATTRQNRAVAEGSYYASRSARDPECTRLNSRARRSTSVAGVRTIRKEFSARGGRQLDVAERGKRRQGSPSTLLVWAGDGGEGLPPTSARTPGGYYRREEKSRAFRVQKSKKPHA